MSSSHPVSRPQGNNGLTLNFCEVILNKDRIALLKTPYSDELFETYKNDNEYYAHREGNSLYVWPLVFTDCQVPEDVTRTDITLEEYDLIFNKLIETSIVGLFRTRGYSIDGCHYLIFQRGVARSSSLANIPAVASC